MAKLQIKRREDAKHARVGTWHDYDFLIDGHEPTFLTGLSLDFSADGFPEAKLSFLAEELDIDAETLASMKIMVNEQEQKQGLQKKEKFPLFWAIGGLMLAMILANAKGDS